MDNFEKKYKEAIRRGFDYIRHTPATEMVTRQDILEAIFPELKESEDERIRKALIDWFSDKHAAADFRDIAWERIVAWLEKQGEKDKEILVLKDQVESLHAAIKALKEVHKIELEKKGEHKSSWSEEDERNINELLYLVEANYLSFAEPHNRLINFLKSLKDRVQPQPKQEWSEEDETMLENIREILTKRGFHQIQANWLKSLKERFLPQSKLEWNEDDEKIYKKIETAIDSYYAPFSRDTEEMQEWFKNLKNRVQSQQEWSEEDENLLNRLIGVLDGTNKEDYHEAWEEKFLPWLKDLKERIKLWSNSSLSKNNDL